MQQPRQPYQPQNYPTLVNFSRGDTSSPRDWVSNATEPGTRSSGELDAYLTRLIGGFGGARGLIVTGNYKDTAKNLTLQHCPLPPAGADCAPFL